VIKALLLDLDDTLLENDMGTFIPAYLDSLGRYLSQHVDPDQMVEELLQGTQAMLENRNPLQSLETTFSEYFYPALSVDPQDLRPIIDSFYREAFPELRKYTQQKPAAAKLIAGAIDTGIEVAIATNPLFPRTAIEQRLDWAGVSADTFPYAVISSYETFHFTKPHQEYYAEILGRLGTNPHEAAMIGDDPINDLQPARSLGIAVFQTKESPEDGYIGGDLDQAIQWIEGLSKAPDRRRNTSPEILLARLRGNMAALIGMVAEISPPDWTKKPDPAEWAPVEIICHLRDVEIEINQFRYEAFSSKDEPFFSAVDSDRWALERNYIEQSGPQALNSFLKGRLESLSFLEQRHAESWTHKAQHALLGPTDLSEIVSIVVDHDIIHLAQLRSALH
jgi:HAD superfamily hydrolase (TIGR01549 family)